MTHSVTFRFATLTDAPAVVLLVESAYRGDESKMGWTTESDILDGQRTDLEEVRGLIGNVESRLILAYDGPALRACCHVERQNDSAYFGMFSVAPRAQNGGLGKTVLAEAERVAKDVLGCREMRMTVIDIRTELIRWYERRGYTRTGEHKPFPYGDPRFGLPKRDDLRFEVLTKTLGVASLPREP